MNVIQRIALLSSDIVDWAAKFDQRRRIINRRQDVMKTITFKIGAELTALLYRRATVGSELTMSRFVSYDQIPSLVQERGVLVRQNGQALMGEPTDKALE